MATSDAKIVDPIVITKDIHITIIFIDSISYDVNIISNNGKPHTNMNAINIAIPFDDFSCLSGSVFLYIKNTIIITTIANMIQGRISAPCFDKEELREYDV